jgi:hypothetical protein
LTVLSSDDTFFEEDGENELLDLSPNMGDLLNVEDVDDPDLNDDAFEM